MGPFTFTRKGDSVSLRFVLSNGSECNFVSHSHKSLSNFEPSETGPASPRNLFHPGTYRIPIQPLGRRR